MGTLSRAGLAFVLILAGCSAAPAAATPTPTPFGNQPAETEPLDSEPVDTEAPTTQAVEPTPTVADPASSGLPLSDGNGWPMEVSATLSGTFYDSDGSYSGKGAARWCGNALGNIMGNVRAFNFEFPLDQATGNIGDVTFSADNLVPGASTSVFNISVNVHTAGGGEPAATVVAAGETGTAVSGKGSATLTVDGGKRTLELQAVSDAGETIKLKGFCSPS